MEIELFKAFADKPDQGNPAGVIFNADNLTQDRMIEIAATLNYSESVFIVKPSTSEADYRLRFMTSITEVDSCGHATLAGAQAIYEKKPFNEIKVETGAGILSVYREEDGSLMMKMARSELVDKEYDKTEIGKLLGIRPSDMFDLPIITASVGSPKLMIPVKHLNIVETVQPDFEAMIEFCKKYPVKGFYVFTKEVILPGSNFHARQFNPAAGIPEDPITGVAGGALALYARAYNLIIHDQIIIEQGFELGKPGRIVVQINDGAVYVGGNAVRFGSKRLEI
ncbi:MAG: PhzF family phenazine biosynthesis protein [Candidatus Dojkabacteria bacterium]|nr:MAG: PhzF family phenazine biosynthesis protein [Candidatus Dojkabacteria bacterium]